VLLRRGAAALAQACCGVWLLLASVDLLLDHANPIHLSLATQPHSTMQPHQSEPNGTRPSRKRRRTSNMVRGITEVAAASIPSAHLCHKSGPCFASFVVVQEQMFSACQLQSSANGCAARVVQRGIACADARTWLSPRGACCALQATRRCTAGWNAVPAVRRVHDDACCPIRACIVPRELIAAAAEALLVIWQEVNGEE